MPTLVERCVHQDVPDTGRHVLFKEQWDKCKNCTYDPVNNKKCPGYSPKSYYAYENNPNQNREDIRA
jgi:hypothetical protein